MSDKIFLDTNILVYVHSSDELAKRHIIENIIDKIDDIVISTQVINEFINVMSKKRKIAFDKLALVAQELSTHFSIAQVTISTIDQALKIAQKYRYSYFDSLIVATALESGCSIVYTEDMHHQQTIENKLIIKNPFK